jgi:branched-subunit amino acid ABC-type transport system permease component
LAYAAVPVVLIGPLSAIVPGKPIQFVGSIVQLTMPAAIAIAVLRYRLYDIDVLINRTLVYGSTSVAIAVAFFAGLVVLQAVLRPFTAGSDFAVAVSTLASFALFQPIRRAVQSAVDRSFYRSRYDAVRTLDAFGVRLRDEVDLDAVRADLIEAVQRSVQPAHASVWLRARL